MSTGNSPKWHNRPALEEPMLVRFFLIMSTYILCCLILFLPLCVVFFEALRQGIPLYYAALVHPETQSALLLTLTISLFCVPINSFFGFCAAWAAARFTFRGKYLLLTLIDMPFSISPIVVGLAYATLFSPQGYVGSFFRSHDIEVLFALPSMILVTTFVTFPFVARELIPLLESQGSESEEVALTLGASPFRMFWDITLPNARWGLLYGVLLCNARAMGEFGAVAIVSGHIRGLTHTLTLQIEALYQDYDLMGAFALASLLACLALVTLVMKAILERWRVV